mmetsp:Transcript_42184/g.119709  ORF Transcript_42184/g.119709 Transcript_42184/m.119709 type:complete len:237 (+) Transcript_42184:731-1441(+)
MTCGWIGSWIDWSGMRHKRGCACVCMYVCVCVCGLVVCNRPPILTSAYRQREMRAAQHSTAQHSAAQRSRALLSALHTHIFLSHPCHAMPCSNHYSLQNTPTSLRLRLDSCGRTRTLPNSQPSQAARRTAERTDRQTDRRTDRWMHCRTAGWLMDKKAGGQGARWTATHPPRSQIPHSHPMDQSILSHFSPYESEKERQTDRQTSVLPFSPPLPPSRLAARPVRTHSSVRSTAKKT